MSPFGIARIVGVLIILVVGGFVGLSSPENVIAIATISQVLNTAFLFLIMTFAYEWMTRQAS